VPAAHGGALERLDSRALVILRETLAFHSPLADFAFAMQGLGSGAITLAGTPQQQERYLPAVAQGRRIAAFALSEPDAGSDVAAMATTARFEDTTGQVVLDGTKTWISNGGIADYYCVFAKTDPGAGTRGITAFIVDAGSPGLDDSEHIAVMAPHPLATLRFQGCRIPAATQLGALHGGFKLAMQTLDIFRASVAGAALGMARRALQEAVAHARQRPMFGQRLADFQLTQAKSRRNVRAGGRRRAADLPRGLAAGLRRHRHAGAGAGLFRAGGHGQDGGHRERAAGDRHGAADARRAGRASWAPRSRACTATSARCASTRGPPRCSSSSLANPF
jgi:alkylation response protein AidB-like acyl-CoA dehydrogenase